VKAAKFPKRKPVGRREARGEFNEVIITLRYRAHLRGVGIRANARLIASPESHHGRRAEHDHDDRLYQRGRIGRAAVHDRKPHDHAANGSVWERDALDSGAVASVDTSGDAVANVSADGRLRRDAVTGDADSGGHDTDGRRPGREPDWHRRYGRRDAAAGVRRVRCAG
jgi:hypothetical protein